MALLFADGFDHIEDGCELLKWDYSDDVAKVFYTPTAGRNGGPGMYLYEAITNADVVYGKYVTLGSATFIFGAALKIDAFRDDDDPFLQFKDSATSQIEVRFMNAGVIGVYRNGTLLGLSAAGEITLDTWFYFEIKVLLDSTVGTAEVRVNGLPVIDLSGINTQDSANASINTVVLRAWWAIHFYVDDLYFCDDTGTTNNDFLGDTVITTLYPTSDGTYSDFDPSTGVDNYAVVDDPQLAAATDYNSSATIGAKDTYGMTTYAESGDIFGVQVTVAVQCANTGSMIVSPMVRSGTTPADDDGDNTALSQSLKAARSIWESEPTDVVDWTAAKINAAEFGLKIQS